MMLICDPTPASGFFELPFVLVTNRFSSLACKSSSCKVLWTFGFIGGIGWAAGCGGLGGHQVRRTLPAVIRLSAAAARIVSVPVQSGILYLTPPLLASGGRAGCAMRAWEKSFFLELPKAHLRTLPVVSAQSSPDLIRVCRPGRIENFGSGMNPPNSIRGLYRSTHILPAPPRVSDYQVHANLVCPCKIGLSYFRSIAPGAEHAANLKAKSFEHLEVSVSNKRHSFLGLLWTFRTRYLSMR
ncbi:hypothetical protein B0H13DRAFT_1922181 [Mycena leptocephala]|nr:hypothetical protein B0H13DRAFT_1922181 [Mycena leptocephala]